MQENENEKTDPTYRPYSWIVGFLFSAFIIWIMFELSLAVGR